MWCGFILWSGCILNFHIIYLWFSCTLSKTSYEWCNEVKKQNNTTQKTNLFSLFSMTSFVDNIYFWSKPYQSSVTIFKSDFDCGFFFLLLLFFSGVGAIRLVYIILLLLFCCTFLKMSCEWRKIEHFSVHYDQFLLNLFRKLTTLLLMANNWQIWKRIFLTCPCHEIYRDEAVGLKVANILSKILILVKM